MNDKVKCSVCNEEFSPEEMKNVLEINTNAIKILCEMAGTPLQESIDSATENKYRNARCSVCDENKIKLMKEVDAEMEERLKTI